MSLKWSVELESDTHVLQPPALPFPPSSLGWSVSNVCSCEQPRRGQRPTSNRSIFPSRQADPTPRRVPNRDRDISADQPPERNERHPARDQATPRSERALPDGLRNYLHEDPILTEATRRVPEGVLRARRHVLTHEESRLFRDSSAQADAPRDMSSNQPSRDLQRRFSREPAPRRNETQLPSFVSLTGPGPAAVAASLPPLRNLQNRRSSSNLSNTAAPSGRPTRSRAYERRLERYRNDHRDAGQLNAASFEDSEYDLEDANSQLRALLEYTTPTISSPLSPPANTHTPHHDHTEDSRRVKRRKLDERPGASFKGFRYGRFGQVLPGQLKMEIETCDGGVFADDENNPPESILEYDDSVYCTKRDCCNIVLRHQGATVFTLSELVIRAPGPSFSAP